MKNYLLLFILLGTVLMGCKDDDPVVETDPYQISMVVEKPVADAVVNVNEPMDVKVNFTRGAEEVIHHVKIFVLDSSDNVVDTLLEEHAHVAASYTYEGTYTPTATGAFKLKVASHDMEDHHATPVFVNFTVN